MFNIRTINPKTGLPEAFDSEPASFGKIASEAFEKTVDDRYRLSIEQEIKAKAASEAMAAESFDDPVSVYEKNFGNYVEEMKANATGRYKNFINVTGSAYLGQYKIKSTTGSIKERTSKCWRNCGNTRSRRLPNNIGNDYIWCESTRCRFCNRKP